MPGELLIHYGNPGSGKTLFALKDIILPCCKDKRPFFTNITGISVSALSALTGVHQAFIKYYPVNDISDVIRYFDDEAVSHDGVFILDEMKDFIDNDRAVSWLESRVNVMRKHAVDFVFIAQQPKKEYIHPNLLGLANASNVFRTRKRENDPKHVTQYFVNGGLPKILNNDVANAVGESVREKPVEMYNCYETSESAFYKGEENTTYFGLKWYQERKWKFRFVIIGFFIAVLVIAVLLVVGLYSISNKGINLAQTKTSEAGNAVQNKTPSPAVVAQDTSTCFKYILCDTHDCRTESGVFPIEHYHDDSGVLCVDGRCRGKCERTYDVPDGGGLLSIGRKVPSR